MVITQNNFNSEVENSDKPVLIDFWASWCGPCMMMSPVVEQIEKEHPEIKVGKVNVDEEMVLAQKFMVVSIPTLILFKNGKPEITSVGFKGKEELEEIFKLKYRNFTQCVPAENLEYICRGKHVKHRFMALQEHSTKVLRQERMQTNI